jgi:hypothetical protein
MLKNTHLAGAFIQPSEILTGTETNSFYIGQGFNRPGNFPAPSIQSGVIETT